MILSFLFLFINNKVNDNFGAGDLVTSLPTELDDRGKGEDYDEIHKLITDIYNDLTNGTLPAFALKTPFFYSRPRKQLSYQFFNHVTDWKKPSIDDLKDYLSPGSVHFYHFLWYKYIKGERKVLFFCAITKVNSCEDPKKYTIPISEHSKDFLETIMKNKTKGIILEGDISSPPCKDAKIIKTFKLENICNFNKNISNNPLPLLGMLKYNKQSPVFLENNNEYDFLFAGKNHSLKKFGYSSENFKPVKQRPNAFVALCSFDHDLEDQNFEVCNFFFRSFTNMGMGYTANGEIAHALFKSKNYGSPGNLIFLNYQIKPKKMKYAGNDYALRVLIENNQEEVDLFENTKSEENQKGILNLKPKERKVSLHNPLEPANMRSNSFSIPLGYSTVVYITPKVREIDESAASLSESERGCRLSTDASGLDIFKIYSREGCLLDCKIKQAYTKCGCFPWNYPIVEVRKRCFRYEF